jgi:hypothetical protein
MGADNTIALYRLADGALVAANGQGGEPLTAHFRSEAARVLPPDARIDTQDFALAGKVVQTQYVGQVYRYRVRTQGADVWGHASERIAEGAAVAVAVPRDALLVFPRAATPVHA